MAQWWPHSRAPEAAAIYLIAGAMGITVGAIVGAFAGGVVVGYFVYDLGSETWFRIDP